MYELSFLYVGLGYISYFFSFSVHQRLHRQGEGSQADHQELPGVDSTAKGPVHPSHLPDYAHQEDAHLCRHGVHLGPEGDVRCQDSVCQERECGGEPEGVCSGQHLPWL